MKIKRLKIKSVLLLVFSLLQFNTQAATPIPPPIPTDPIDIVGCMVITSPGSYLLRVPVDASGLSGICIEIQSSYVTIDFGGHPIYGPGFAGNPIQLGDVGVGLGADVEGITLYNGTIMGFSLGIELAPNNTAFNATGVVVKDMVVMENGGAGIFSGEGALIKNNISSNNGTDGIIVGVGSSIIGNVANNNLVGIVVTCPTTLLDNASVLNTTNFGTIGGFNGCKNKKRNVDN